MSIEIISAETIWHKQQRQNKYRRWPTRQKPEHLYPLAEPHIKTHFQIEPGDKIFCLGSASTAQLGRTLKQLNYTVLSAFNNLPRADIRKNEDDCFFKYNVASIYNELSWALNPNTPYQHEQVFIETPEKGWQDYQLRGSRYTDDLESAKLFRDSYRQAFQQIKQADAIIINLAASEVWFDKEKALYLNVGVTEKLSEYYPNRFEVHIFNHQDTLHYLNAIYDLLCTYIKADIKLLLAISPLPLISTARQQDVLLANTYSKAVLRTAIEHFIANKHNVSYIPDYECAVLSYPTVVWNQEDLRHLDNLFVDYVIAKIIAHFTVQDKEGINSTIAKAKVLYQHNFHTEAKQALQPLLENKPIQNKELFLLSTALNLGIKSRFSFISALTYIKNNRYLGISKLFSRLQRSRAKQKNTQFIGYIDNWHNGQLIGWAINKKSLQPVKLKILLNGNVISTIVADQARPDVAEVHTGYIHCGFNVTLNLKQHTNNKIQVVFVDNKQELVGSPIYAV